MARYQRTFLWHDYESSDKVARRARPAQFAAIRTDEDLNIIGKPIMIYCKPAPDFLPSPEACLVTGITPQECLEKGVPEVEFSAMIESEFSKPGTIGVGYNTLKYDDEMTRFMLWRNLADPYAREWKDECGRWDLLLVVRAVYALRNRTLTWPLKDHGGPSFRLEDLAKANGLMHEKAHDALSDVEVTIALARLIKERQPQLWEHCLRMHKKDMASAEVGYPHSKMFLHIDGLHGTERGCIGLMAPLSGHPTNKNELISWNLSKDPAPLLTMTAKEVRANMFTKKADAPEGFERLGLNSVAYNKSPMVWGSPKPEMLEGVAAKWKIDVEKASTHLNKLAEIGQQRDLFKLFEEVYARDNEDLDPDEDLYGGFVGKDDRKRLDRIRSLPVSRLAAEDGCFDDARLETLFFRYKARNFPEILTADEMEEWENHRHARLIDGEHGFLTIEGLKEEVAALMPTVDEGKQAILRKVVEYADQIAPKRKTLAPRP